MKNLKILPSTILSIILLTLFAYPISSVITFNEVTYDKLRNWSYMFDDTYRIIILNQQLIPELQNSLPIYNDIQYYSYDCKINSTLLTTCSHHNTHVVIIYNKIPLQFQTYLQQNNIQTLSNNVIQWINQIKNSIYKKNLLEKDILSILQKQGQIFILVQNKTIHELQIGYKILAKQFYYQNFVYFSDLGLAKSYGLEIGNYLHIKNIHTQNLQQGQLVKMIKNTKITTFLPKQIQPRYDYLKMFVLQNIYGLGFDKNMINVQQQRFSLQVHRPNQKGEFAKNRNVIIFCDLSKECLKFWDSLNNQICENNQVSLGATFRRFFYRAQIFKYLEYIQVFYHLKLRKIKLPYMVVLNGQDPTTPYLPQRYIKQLQTKQQNPYMIISKYLKQIDQRKQQKISLISSIPKKNGFTGKGSQKNVQKLTYLTYKQVLQNVKKTQTFYLLFITAFQFDCSDCLKFYNQYKKLASFIQAQQSLKVILGVYDLSKDQIDMQYVKHVPSLFLFTPYQKQPIYYRNRYQFQYVLNFLKKEISKAKQNIQKQKKSTQKIEQL